MDLDPDLGQTVIPTEVRSATGAPALRLAPVTDLATRRKVRRPRVAHDPEYSEAFKAFWAKYPGFRKNVPDVCWKVWQDRGLEQVAPKIMAALEWQVESRDWTKEDGQYVCAPVVYLRSSKWKDERPKYMAASGGTGRHSSSTEAMIARARAGGPEIDPSYLGNTKPRGG